MEATMVSDAPKHYPVLLDEIISIITPQHGGTFIDCTFGQGGYTEKILSFKNTQVIALDRDIESKKKAEKFQKKFGQRFVFKNKRFSQLNDLKLKDLNVRGVIFDLGFSYSQIKDTKKGLSFNSEGELNMKMGLNTFSAKDVINKLSKKELELIFKFFGEEREAKKISSKIDIERNKKQIDTKTLAKLIDGVKSRKSFKIHSATKTFQALRIFVNKEISELINGLISAAKILDKGGILLVVTFNSLEDKIVKYFFKSLSENKSVSRYMPKEDKEKILFKLLKRKPIIPTEKETIINPPSRSAKLRYVIKKDNFFEFKTDILKKFNFLIKIENLGNKL